nr:PREDICTED: SKI family transcriptional corepressor 2 [Latimeria chalumnae]|eukprot:XP_014348514.1 PREDICTED: SKI family transcriptional corepressor 2 [Latimeria chalumnae]
MDKSPLPGPNDIVLTPPPNTYQQDSLIQQRPNSSSMKPNQVSQVILYGVPIVSLIIDGQERLCLAQISNTLLKNYSYNEIHNRRVALGITCVQCTPVQLEILRRAGAMPISSRRCGMITKREAERLCKSFLGENRPPKLPDNFAFDVTHECAWGSRGSFIPARYNSSRAKCIKCSYCNMYFSPNKFIFHSHRTPEAKYTQPDAANFNSWRRHLKLTDKNPADELVYAWEDVKAMFNGGSRKRALPHGHCSSLNTVKAVSNVIPHMLTPDITQKRARFEEDEDIDVTNISASKNQRNYPVIPVPSKGFGMLQKFPATSLFPNPYTFPAFGLCQKKDDNDTISGQKPIRKQSYHSAFRPVVKDVESIAKLHGNLEEFGSDRHLSPGTSCSYQSDSADTDEEQEVDVETNKLQDDEESDHLGTQYLQTRVLQENGDQGNKDRPLFPLTRMDSHEEKTENRENSLSAQKESSPAHTSLEKSCYKDNHNNGGSQSAVPAKEDSSFSVSEPEPSGVEFWRETAGKSGQETASPLSLKKDVENMEKEELQKVLLEQIDFRRRLEQEFQALKDNFQDQMKRELAYREEMVQQLQIIPYAASLIRKEKISTHLNKS